MILPGETPGRADVEGSAAVAAIGIVVVVLRQHAGAGDVETARLELGKLECSVCWNLLFALNIRSDWATCSPPLLSVESHRCA
jgi:hypothetical protein